MRICFYSPYIPKHFGGGEKYLLDCAVTLARTHQVSIAIPATTELGAKKADYEEFFGLDLSKIPFVQTPLGTSASFWQKLWWTKDWDVIYYLTDGSLFFSLANKNILHIQFPFTFAKNNVLERLKLFNWQVKNTNSYFTQAVIEKNWRTKIDFVHWPLIETVTKAKGQKKEKVILNVGRFFRQLHSKRQDVLVKIFVDMCRTHKAQTKGWKLVLIGGVEDEGYFREVRKLAQGWPIEFHTDIDRAALESWYGRASIYWHATGYGIDEIAQPEKVEHFGISTVEAMSFGCVPIVVGKGGQKEILDEQLSHLQWQTLEECIERTLVCLDSATERQKLGDLAKARAQAFGQARFASQLNSMIK